MFVKGRAKQPWTPVDSLEPYVAVGFLKWRLTSMARPNRLIQNAATVGVLAIYWSRELECGQLRLGIKWLEMAKRLEIPPGSAVLKIDVNISWISGGSTGAWLSNEEFLDEGWVLPPLAMYCILQWWLEVMGSRPLGFFESPHFWILREVWRERPRLLITIRSLLNSIERLYDLLWAFSGCIPIPSIQRSFIETILANDWGGTNMSIISLFACLICRKALNDRNWRNLILNDYKFHPGRYAIHEWSGA